MNSQRCAPRLRLGRWNNVAALKDYGVGGGYTDPATCASAGTAAPCYLPRDVVQRVQVVSIVGRRSS